MSNEKEQLGKPDLVGDELDELESDFDFDIEEEYGQTLSNIDESNTLTSETTQTHTPVSKPKKQSILSILIVSALIASTMAYFYLTEDMASDTPKVALNPKVTPPPVKNPLFTKKENPSSNQVLDSKQTQRDEDLFLKLNGMQTEGLNALEEKLSKKITKSRKMALSDAQAFIENLLKQMGDDDFQVSLELKKVADSFSSIQLEQNISREKYKQVNNNRMQKIEEELGNLSLLSASTNIDLQKIIIDYKKSNDFLKNKVVELENILSGINQTALPGTTQTKKIATTKSIKGFMSYILIGFDRQKKSVWIKDKDANVIKVKKSSFLPEYGTVMSITDDGKIVTELGFVKFKDANE